VTAETNRDFADRPAFSVFGDYRGPVGHLQNPESEESNIRPRLGGAGGRLSGLAGGFPAQTSLPGIRPVGVGDPCRLRLRRPGGIEKQIVYVCGHYGSSGLAHRLRPKWRRGANGRRTGDDGIDQRRFLGRNRLVTKEKRHRVCL